MVNITGKIHENNEFSDDEIIQKYYKKGCIHVENLDFKKKETFETIKYKRIRIYDNDVHINLKQVEINYSREVTREFIVTMKHYYKI